MLLSIVIADNDPHSIFSCKTKLVLYYKGRKSKDIQREIYHRYLTEVTQY